MLPPVAGRAYPRVTRTLVPTRAVDVIDLEQVEREVATATRALTVARTRLRVRLLAEGPSRHGPRLVVVRAKNRDQTLAALLGVLEA
jgi:hypothetical protein